MYRSARSWSWLRCRMMRGDTLRKRLPSRPLAANAVSICWMQRRFNSTASPSSTAAAKSSAGVCSEEPRGPRTSASYPVMRPSRKLKIGWNSVASVRSSRTRRSCRAISCRACIAWAIIGAFGWAARSRLCGPVAAEPVEQPLPSVLRGRLAIGRAIVGEERVRRGRIRVDLAPLAGGRERLAHALDAFDRDARIRAAIEAQHGRLDPLHEIDGMLRLERGSRPFDASVPCDPRLQLRVVRRVEPYDAPAPAEAGDGEARRIAAVLRRPAGRVVEVRHHLLVGNPGDDRADLVDARELGHVALPRVELGREREIAELREAPCDVLDVLMDAENLLHDEDDRQVAPVGGHRAIGRHVAVAHRNAHLTGDEALRV